MTTMNQYKAVQEQYKTADNLNTRISIHEKYSTNKTGFGNWIFSHYNFPAGSNILELGCGTGSMWQSKLHLIVNDTKLTLTDFSENMVSVAQNTLGAHENVSYGVANIENLPYTGNCFDRVIANMMLYHVSDLDKGLSEVRRVLTMDGYFYCATYGENGMMEYIAGLFKEYGIRDTTNKNFTLQNGYGILQKYFSDIRRLNYEDSLAVTDVGDLLDYIYSLTNMSSVAKFGRQILKETLEKEMVNGVLNIPKEYGMFICRK